MEIKFSDIKNHFREINEKLKCGFEFKFNWLPDDNGERCGWCRWPDGGEPLIESKQTGKPPDNYIAHFLHETAHAALSEYHKNDLIPHHGIEFLSILWAIHGRYIDNFNKDLTHHIRDFIFGYDSGDFTDIDYHDYFKYMQPYAGKLAGNEKLNLIEVADKIVKRVEWIRYLRWWRHNWKGYIIERLNKYCGGEVLTGIALTVFVVWFLIV